MSPSYGGQFEQMEIANIEHAFLTHIHSDHSGGLADLVLSPWVMGRDTELKLFGPKGLKSMVSNITEAYQLDIDYRLYGTQPANKKGFVSTAKEIIGTSNVKVASVSSYFPSGQVPIESKLLDTQYAIDEGADEIDIVINRKAFFEGDYRKVYDEIVCCLVNVVSILKLIVINFINV